MIALKLITQALQTRIAKNISPSCYHVKGHGGLKKAVQNTHAALSEYKYVFRSDIESYYESINFTILIDIIETYVKHPILSTLILKACRRTETSGGNFYDYHQRGLPKRSPLSPLLGALALLPLDYAMEGMPNIFYARFMDDWILFTNSKTALRKAIKRTHGVMKALQLRLHPTKTYIGKIQSGFNFLGFYMDHQTTLPSKETIRRFSERAFVRYAHVPSRLHQKNSVKRDVSCYQVNEVAPTEAYIQGILTTLYYMASKNKESLARLQSYVRRWALWLKNGMTAVLGYEMCITTFLPSLALCWEHKDLTHILRASVN